MKSIDLNINSMGQRDHYKKVVEIAKGCEELYTQAKILLEQVQKWYDKHANKTLKHMEFEVGQHMWPKSEISRCLKD
jgi:hypothetical protein